MATPSGRLIEIFNSTIGRVIGREMVSRRYFEIIDQEGRRESSDPLGDLTIESLSRPTRAKMVERRRVVIVKKSV
jgi:hypothetical protein